MNRKRNILIYLDSYPMVAALALEQRGLLFTALMVYGDRLSQEGGVELEEVLDQFPQLLPETRAVCGFMAGNILRDTQKWLDRQQSRNRSGKGKYAPAESTPAEEQRIRADMERSRHLIEQMKE